MSHFSQTALATRQSDPDESRFPAGKLLIVDDLPDNRAVLTRRFERRGFEIVEADCGPEALRLVDEQTFDCVLLDVMMPGMDGTRGPAPDSREILALASAGRHGDRQEPVGGHRRGPQERRQRLCDEAGGLFRRAGPRQQSNRPAARRGAHRPHGAPRPADRSHQPHGVLRAVGARPRRLPTPSQSPSRCFASTSTASRR